MPDALLIEGCNFEDYPAGGQLAFAKQLLRAFGNRFALVGISTDSTPVGRWVERTIDGRTYQYFAVSRADKSKTSRPLIPLRIWHYLAIRRYAPAIRAVGVRKVFTQCAQVMLAIHKFDWDSIAYCFPSVKNEVEFSRYPWARLLKDPYERGLFRALRKADAILAAADSAAIGEMIERSNGVIDPLTVVPFPTRADATVFHPMNRHQARAELRLNQDATLLLSCGKLMYIKGWRLLLEALKRGIQKRPKMELVFLGDGEDRAALEEMARHLGVDGRVRLAGVVPPATVAQYMNAADLFLVGSLQEGWSVAMVEALSCGLPIVSTDVSGARDLIENDVNGYVVMNRDPDSFTRAIHKALELEGAKSRSLAIGARYSLDTLAPAFERAWPAFSQREANRAGLSHGICRANGDAQRSREQNDSRS